MTDNFRDKNIFLKEGSEPGKTLAIFGGVHGNETVGVLAIKKAIDEIEIKRGKVFFVFANPEAIEKNVRMIDKNLNRMLLKSNVGTSKEDDRARDLMKLLDSCDALLDIHSSNNKKTSPFIICDKKDLDVASKLNFSIVSYGWDPLEPGSTDAYMHEQDKPGICIECGNAHEPEKYLDLALTSIKQFLQYFDVIDKIVPYNDSKQSFVEVFKVAKKKTDDLSFIKPFDDFEILEAGKVFAKDGDEEYTAGVEECIIFPHADTKIGQEAFLLGRKVK